MDRLERPAQFEDLSVEVPASPVGGELEPSRRSRKRKADDCEAQVESPSAQLHGLQLSADRPHCSSQSGRSLRTRNSVARSSSSSELIFVMEEADAPATVRREGRGRERPSVPSTVDRTSNVTVASCDGGYDTVGVWTPETPAERVCPAIMRPSKPLRLGRSTVQRSLPGWFWDEPGDALGQRTGLRAKD